tara:strand:+ start:4115 stop:5545 length:1431 start_codon:yes stop_codon:yes gene_type:complete
MIDLRESIVILGGGMAGAFAAKELLDANYKVVIIDAGYCENDKIDNYNHEISSPSYKFNIKSNEFVYKNFASKLNIKTNNFNAIGSLATGGLSNIWGGGLSKFAEYEYQSNGSDHSEIAKIYEEVQREMQLEIERAEITQTNQIYDKRLQKLFGEVRNKISFSSPINAFNEKNSNDKENKNHGIFNANTLIKKLIKNKGLKVISNSFIKRLSKNQADYVLETSNKLSGEEENYLLKNIFCCLGVISTTKLILELEEVFNSPIPLKTTPLGYFLVFTSKKRENNTKFGLSSLSYNMENHKHYISGGIFPCNIEVLSYYKFFNFLPKFLKLFIDKILLQRILIGNIFFSSSMSSNQIRVFRNGECLIEGKNHHDLKKNYKKIKKSLNTSLKEFHMYILPGIGGLAKPGSDVHYAGTLPIDEMNLTKLKCDNLGKLYGHESLYIADACLVKDLPGKPHSLHSISQSILIARKFIISNSI